MTFKKIVKTLYYKHNNDFTYSEKYVVNFILALKESAFVGFNIKSLAKEMSVSVATISRACIKLGFDSWSQLYELATLLRNDRINYTKFFTDFDEKVAHPSLELALSKKIELKNISKVNRFIFAANGFSVSISEHAARRLSQKLPEMYSEPYSGGSTINLAKMRENHKILCVIISISGNKPKRIKSMIDHLIGKVGSENIRFILVSSIVPSKKVREIKQIEKFIYGDPMNEDLNEKEFDDPIITRYIASMLSDKVVDYIYDSLKENNVNINEN
ncbi:MAG: hypothetical protein NC236_00405 [Mycoplasma sp.]|nr:hypothetical protein [Mycoplasma sp.]